MGGSLSGKYTLILAIVVVLLIVCLSSHVGDAKRHLSGFWVGDPVFLDEAGLKDMYLHIEPAGSGGLLSLLGGSRHEAFLVMATSDGLICNQGVTIRPRFGHGLRRKDTYDCKISLRFDDPDNAPPILEEAEHPRLVLSPVDGSLALYDDDHLLAFFYKDTAASLAAKLN